LDIGVLGYIGIVQHKEHSPEVLSIPPGTPCVYMYKHTHSVGTKIFVYFVADSCIILIYHFWSWTTHVPSNCDLRCARCPLIFAQLLSLSRIPLHLQLEDAGSVAVQH